MCLIQVGDRHTELLGFFLSNFATSEIDLVHRYTSDYSYVDYFERSLKKPFHRVLPEFDRQAHYDLVVLLTSHEAPFFTTRKRIKRLLAKIGLGPLSMRVWFAMKRRLTHTPSPTEHVGEAPLPAAVIDTSQRSTLFKNSAQTIAICHMKKDVATECPNLALSPLLNPLPWLLPVVPGLPTQSADDRRPMICCMGLLEERYYQIIPQLARAMPEFEFRLFVRQAHPTCMALLAGLPNVVVAIGEGTNAMMVHLASSRFLLILDHPDSRHRKDRLCGAIPFGLSLAVPMVMSSELATLYDIRSGVICYDDVPGADLATRLASITPGDYRALIAKMLTERERVARLDTKSLTEFLRAGPNSQCATSITHA